MWDKSDCDYNYIFENFIKNETDFKKRSFYAGYYVHLLTDCLFSRLVSIPIENKFGLYREHPGLSKRVKKSGMTPITLFLPKIKAPHLRILKISDRSMRIILPYTGMEK